MKRSIINLKCLKGLKRDGELIFIAITDEEHYTLVLKVQPTGENGLVSYWVITCIGGVSYEVGYTMEDEALCYAGFETIKYTL